MASTERRQARRWFWLTLTTALLLVLAAWGAYSIARDFGADWRGATAVFLAVLIGALALGGILLPERR